MKHISRLVALFITLTIGGILIAGCSSAPVSATALATPVSTVATAATAVVAPDFPRTVKDGAGNSVTVKSKPIHIVSVTLGTDEILFALVDPSRLAAITANATDPAQSNVVSLAPQVKTQLAKADPEAIIALQPDLVFVASYTDAAVVKQLKDAGLAVFLLGNFATVKDIEDNILLVGQTVGEDQKAQQVVDSMQSRLKAISEAVNGAKKPGVLYYAPDGYSDGPGTVVDDIITQAGGVNPVTAGGIKDAFPQLNDEFVVKQDPDYILLSGYNSYSPNFVDNFMQKANFQTLTAFKNKHVSVANDAHMTAVSQYVVDGVADVAALIHPDLYSATTTATQNALPLATAAATAAQ
jgi:iron complex transport system substrate-binding protein